MSRFANDFEEKADLLIFSGDIANRGKYIEFMKAERLMTDGRVTYDNKNRLLQKGRTNYETMRYIRTRCRSCL